MGLPGSDDTVGRTVAFITLLGEVVPAIFAAVASESRTTVIGGGLSVTVIGAGLIVSVPLR
jgi:hypothetical protein